MCVCVSVCVCVYVCVCLCSKNTFHILSSGLCDTSTLRQVFITVNFVSVLRYFFQIESVTITSLANEPCIYFCIFLMTN